MLCQVTPISINLLIMHYVLSLQMVIPNGPLISKGFNQCYSRQIWEVLPLEFPAESPNPLKKHTGQFTIDNKQKNPAFSIPFQPSCPIISSIRHHRKPKGNHKTWNLLVYFANQKVTRAFGFMYGYVNSCQSNALAVRYECILRNQFSFNAICTQKCVPSLKHRLE